jgi:hypothetical protein
MLLAMAASHDKTLEFFRVLGILDFISDGFIICLDGIGIDVPEIDSVLHLDLDSKKYYCNADPSISLSKEEIYDSVITRICSSDTCKAIAIYITTKEEN